MSLRSAGGKLPAPFASIILLVSVAQGQALNTSVPVNPASSSVAAPGQSAITPGIIYGVDVGIGESDNVTLVSNDKVSQTIAVADVDFDIQKQSRLFQVDAKGDFSYLDYLQNAYGAELIGRFDGTGQVALIPDRLTWTLSESYGQAQIDPYAAVTPTNLESVNYVSTGPNVDFRLGPLLSLDLTARYARTTYEDSPFDSNRLLGSAAFGLQISAQSTVSVDVSTTRVLFDNTVVNTDFDRSSLYGRYDVQGARTELTADAGITRVVQGDETFSGPLVKLQLSRMLSPTQKLSLTMGRDVTDASTGFSNLQSGAAGGIVTAPAAATLANYTVTYATVGWDYLRNRTTIGLSGTWEKDSYEGQPLQDVTRETAQFRVERRLNQAFSAQLVGSLYRNDYANSDFAETDGLIGAALIFREGKGLEVRLRCDHVSRNVTGIGNGYTENRAFLTIGYRPRPAQIS